MRINFRARLQRFCPSRHFSLRSSRYINAETMVLSNVRNDISDLNVAAIRNSNILHSTNLTQDILHFASLSNG